MMCRARCRGDGGREGGRPGPLVAVVGPWGRVFLSTLARVDDGFQGVALATRSSLGDLLALVAKLLGWGREVCCWLNCYRI